MTKDKALEELFLAKKPHFDDHDTFMANLTKRLDAVEFIHQHQEATIRRYKMAMIATFVIGIIRSHHDGFHSFHARRRAALQFSCAYRLPSLVYRNLPPCSRHSPRSADDYR